MYLILLLLLACETVPKTVNPESVYARNLPFSVDGVYAYGIANVPRKNEYRITLKLPKKAVKGFFQTCNREVIFMDTDSVDYTWRLSPKERRK